MNLRERLSFKQLKLKETYEFVGIVTASSRVLLLLLLRFRLFCCLVVFFSNASSIFNFSHFYLRKSSRLLGFGLYAQGMDGGCCQFAWLSLVDENKFMFSWDENRTSI